MSDIRDIRRKARRDLHDAMRVPAYYRAPTSVSWTLVYVRDFTKFKPLTAFGGQSGPAGLSQIQEVQQSILTMRDEFAHKQLELVRGGIFSMEVGVAFKVDNLLPPDDISLTVEVVPIKDTSGFPVPGVA